MNDCSAYEMTVVVIVVYSGCRLITGLIHYTTCVNYTVAGRRLSGSETCLRTVSYP